MVLCILAMLQQQSWGKKPSLWHNP